MFLGKTPDHRPHKCGTPIWFHGPWTIHFISCRNMGNNIRLNATPHEECFSPRRYNVFVVKNRTYDTNDQFVMKSVSKCLFFFSCKSRKSDYLQNLNLTVYKRQKFIHHLNIRKIHKRIINNHLTTPAYGKYWTKPTYGRIVFKIRYFDTVQPLIRITICETTALPTLH